MSDSVTDHVMKEILRGCKSQARKEFKGELLNNRKQIASLKKQNSALRRENRKLKRLERNLDRETKKVKGAEKEIIRMYKNLQTIRERKVKDAIDLSIHTWTTNGNRLARIVRKSKGKKK